MSKQNWVIGLLVVIIVALVASTSFKPNTTNGTSSETETISLHIGERYKLSSDRFITYSGYDHAGYHGILSEVVGETAGYGGGLSTVEYYVHETNVIYLSGTPYEVTKVTMTEITLEEVRG